MYTLTRLLPCQKAFFAISVQLHSIFLPGILICQREGERERASSWQFFLSVFPLHSEVGGVYGQFPSILPPTAKHSSRSFALQMWQYENEIPKSRNCIVGGGQMTRWMRRLIASRNRLRPKSDEIVAILSPPTWRCSVALIGKNTIVKARKERRKKGRSKSNLKVTLHCSLLSAKYSGLGSSGQGALSLGEEKYPSYNFLTRKRWKWERIESTAGREKGHE